MVYRKSVQFGVSQGIVRTFGGRKRFCWVQRSQLMFKVPAFSAHTGSESLTPLVDSRRWFANRTGSTLYNPTFT